MSGGNIDIMYPAALNTIEKRGVSKNCTMKLTFEKGTADFIAECFGKSVDEEGFIINPEDGERVEHRGKDVTVNNLALVEEGSDIFVDDRFGSLVEHVERNR